MSTEERSRMEQRLEEISKLPFREALDELKDLSADVFDQLEAETNVIREDADTIPPRALKFVIEQYSVFSREAIHMLLDAMLRNYDWPELYKEIQENINEEQGKFTKDVPHLEMMRRGYLHDLHIDTDNVSPCCATTTFIRKMKAIFNHNDNAYSAGALLAFEGHAIPEFHIIGAIIDSYNEQLEAGLKEDSLTKLYINGHKDFEIEHEAHLVKSIEPYINEKNMMKMCKGYLMVSLTMDTWWRQLSIEVMRMEAEMQLTLGKRDIEEFDITSRFQPQV
jgi:hypothetical protein